MKKLFSTVLLASIFTALLGSIAFASIITVNVKGNDYTYNSVTKEYVDDGIHRIGLDYNEVFDFISSSNGSSDGGYNKVNIVDYILSGRLGAGDHKYTLINGSAVPSVESWFGAGATSVMINEIAGYSGTNTFGYYTNSGQKVELFAGSATAGASKTFSLAPSQNFGFYLGVPVTGNTYYTDHTKNTSLQEIHAAIFQVDNSSTYIIGFEDLRLASSDKDYQDMIVSVTVANPEPGTMLLMGAGAAGAAFLRRRKASKAA